jgi:hypothetical protein
MEAILFLFLPFLLYVFWGPFAFVYAAKKLIKRLMLQFRATQTILLAIVILVALFLPVGVTSRGGNIPVIYPWWLALLGMFTPAGVDFRISSFVLAVPFVPVVCFYVYREVSRQSKN